LGSSQLLVIQISEATFKGSSQLLVKRGAIARKYTMDCGFQADVLNLFVMFEGWITKSWEEPHIDVSFELSVVF
jgi:hypothetical protein